VLDGCEPAVIANFETALGALAAAGARIERTAFPAFGEILSLHQRLGPILAHEALALHRDRVAGSEAERMDQRVVKRLRAAASFDPAGLEELLAARSRLMAETTTRIGEALVAMPTVAHVAMPIAPLEADPDLFHEVNVKTLRNTTLGNVLGWPGVSLPNGTDPAGLPTGLLLSAPSGADDRLLALSLAAEAALGRSPLHPPGYPETEEGD
jgi:aspartyl-tRNA(Asn)/glutamyl-tRNA(Gln) amidotransferase subunit A